MKKLLLALLFVVLLYTPAQATPDQFSCYATMSHPCPYYAEFYQKCVVELDDWTSPYNYNEVSVWCEGELILKDVMPLGDLIPEYVGGVRQIWPNIYSGMLGVLNVSSPTKVERFMNNLPHLFGQGPGPGGE